MKKGSFLALCLCPYGYIAVMTLLFLLSRPLPALDNDTVIFSVMGTFLLLPGILCLCYLLSIRSFSPAQLASGNLKLKLWSLPAMGLAIGILIYTAVSNSRTAAEGAQEGGLAVFLWFLLALPVFVHSFCLLWTTAICAARIAAISEKQLSPVLILLHWLPAADLIASYHLVHKQKA